MTQHTVHYEDHGNGGRDVTRKVFTTSDGRILGTETERTTAWRGWDGSHTTERVTDTRHFRTHTEATQWIDDMFREHDAARVTPGGHLVILT